MSERPTEFHTLAANCRGFLKADLKAYLDCELSPLRRGLLRWHLRGCAHCREETVWLRRLGEDMRDLEKAAPRPELRKRILANLPPPAPMRQPMKLWRPEGTFARQAPGYALTGLLAVMALAGVFALSRPSLHAKPHRVTPTSEPLLTETPAATPAPTPIETGKPETVAMLHRPDPTSIEADRRYKQWAHEMAQKLQRQPRPTAPKPEPPQTAEVPKVQISPAAEVGDVASLAKRMDALAAQMGGTMTLVSAPQDAPRSVQPAVPLDGPPSGPGAAAPAALPVTGCIVALRLPASRVQDFVQAIKQIGMLSRSAAPGTVNVPSKNTPTDSMASRDTSLPDREGFTMFRLHLIPAK